MALLSGTPASLHNTWHKLVRYKHHSNFLFRCIKRNRIPKDLMLSFELQLVKENDNLQDSCSQHLYNASFNILKDISAAALSKTKVLQRELHFQREHLFRDYEETAAKNIWKRVRNQMVALEINLKR